jgi:hypothetical protein
MANITKEQKTLLSELIAQGHRKFGKVLPRRPYRDDDEGGSGGAEFMFEEHPLFMNQPIGADLNVTPNVHANQDTFDEARKRQNDLTPELQRKMDLALGNTKTPTPTLQRG